MTESAQLPNLFIGSSQEAVTIAHNLQSVLKPYCRATVWDQDVFKLSTYTIPALLQEAEKYDFATLLVTPDDLKTSRHREGRVARDNVIFELGLFVGAFGLNRTFVVQDEAASLPSDLQGLNTAKYSKPDDDNWRRALTDVSLKIDKAIREVTPWTRQRVDALQGRIVELQTDLRNVTWERDALRQANTHLTLRLPELTVRIIGQELGEPLVFFRPKPKPKPSRTSQTGSLHGPSTSPLLQGGIYTARNEYLGPDGELTIEISNGGSLGAKDIHGWIDLDASLLGPYKEAVGVRALRNPAATSGWVNSTNSQTMELEPQVQVYLRKPLIPGTRHEWTVPFSIHSYGMGKLRYRFSCNEGVMADGEVPIEVRQAI